MSKALKLIRHAAATGFFLALTACAAQPTWEHSSQGEHPLVGKIWDTKNNRFVSQRKVLERLVSADYVLLGEKHDNRDHHRLQADMVRALAARGWKPRLGFEMIGRDKTPAVNAYLESGTKDASGLGSAVEWEKTGWPDWSLYQPIADAALQVGGSVMPLNMPKQQTRNVMSHGFDVLDAEITSRTELNKPLSKAAAADLEEEIRESHCNQIPESLVAKMSLAQRARDAVMAYFLAAPPDAPARSKTVLIAGAGHTRKDRGIPYYLIRLQPKASIVNLAFREVRGSEHEASGYGDALTEDFIWFTPRVDESDPCDRFKEQIRSLRKKE